MLTLDLGPLSLGANHGLLLASLLFATVTGWWLGRRQGRNPEGALFWLLLLALLVARLAFVVVYGEHYADAPWRVLDIRDGGFLAPAGVLVALSLGAWRCWRDPGLRRPLGIALVVGVLSWGGGRALLASFERATGLPEVTLVDAQGSPVALQTYLGKPLVINLWATWCPPCRREMPVLAEAQAREDEVVFLFVNQGEGALEVQRFLASQGLELDNQLFDPGARLGREVGSRALPTTLFYDAHGRQRGSHLGELSRASLARALEALQAD